MVNQPPKIGDITISAGDGNSFGDIGHKIVVGKPQRRMTEETKRGLERMISRDRAVHVLARQGDREAQTLADEIDAFLRASGFKMAQANAGWHQFQTQKSDINVSALTTPEGVQTLVVVESAA